MPKSYVNRTAPELQQKSAWVPPSGVLGELVQQAGERAEELRRDRKTLEARAAARATPPSFAAALHGPTVSVVAEIKRASPSRGVINAAIDAAAQAAALAEGGAAAISVLTEGTRFGGSLEDLERTSAAVSIPLLRKDFIVAEEQALEATAYGASAVLLIARALPPLDLRRLIAFTRSVGLEPLVEVRSSAELDRALADGARVVGINARDLETLEIDHSVVLALLPRVPAEIICVAESGLMTRRDVERVARAGTDAVLVGSSVSVSGDPAAAVRALTGVRRQTRAAGD